MSQESEKEFTGKVNQIVQNSFTCLMIEIGQKLKLFDLLGEITNEEAHKTAQEIADASGLRERYIREWLGAMVCSGIVESEPCGTKFWLPKHRVPGLSGTKNILINFGSSLSMFAKVSEQIQTCFKPEGPNGLPYENYTDFTKFMSALSNQRNTDFLIPVFLPQVPGLLDRLRSGIKCLDIGCGIGVPSRLMGAEFPNSEFWAVDFSREAIETAAAKTRLANVHYLEMDTAQLPPDWTDKFDYITAFDAIHDQARPDLVLKEIRRALKPGGVFSMFDIKGSSNPYTDREERIGFAPMGYAVSLLHCMPVSLYFPGGIGLGTMWGRKRAEELVKNAGFSKIEELPLSYAPANCHYICQ